MTKFRVTCDVITEESAEQGDFAESGFYSRGGWKHADASDWTLHEVVSEFGRNRLQECGGSFYSIDSDINYSTGAETSYTVHPPESISAASYARVARILAYRSAR